MISNTYNISPSNMKMLELISLTLVVNCFNRLYFTNCCMLLRTNISIGISNVSPPSLTHGCSEISGLIKTLQRLGNFSHETVLQSRENSKL